MSNPLRVYYGWRLGDETTADEVVVRYIPNLKGNTTPRDLPLHLDVANHSPTGFSWGYYGSGPAQLALAILVDHAGHDTALKYYQQFKCQFVAGWDKAWIISSHEIDAWIELMDKTTTETITRVGGYEYPNVKTII